VTAAAGAAGEAEASPRRVRTTAAAGGEASASPAHTYAAAGVSLATADAIVDRLRAAVASTATPAVAGAFGAFAGLFAIDDRRLLAASTDSVGSKLVLGRRGDRLRWCGADLAAHCINDVLTTGADPLFFLDYVAANTIDVEQVAELIEGAADVCREAGCAILGGETAELPGIYREGEIDFCGTAVGVVDRDRVVDGSRIEVGDVVLGFASAGIHANGFSLVRRIVGEGPFDADLLLPSTRLYLDEVRALRSRADVRGLAHVTGGGIAGNLSRVLPDGVGAVVDAGSWERPEVFGWLAENGVAEEELRRVFNIGIGYCAVVPAADLREGDLVIGEVIAGAGVSWA
jgi:phosphoribosylformylglycinamidine cyclo-ligase